MDNHFSRIPKHIGIIPDGNRRWALQNNFQKHEGYYHGVEPGFKLYRLLLKYKINEATFYGFTNDNTRRPSIQTLAYTKSCVDAVNMLENKDANLLVIGDNNSRVFPDELQKYANKRVSFGKGLININFLVNYDWSWDINQADSGRIKETLASKDISRLDLIIRWGGRNRLSGFLPIQSIYADLFTIESFWPDFTEDHFLSALRWYQDCDDTLGG